MIEILKNCMIILAQYVNGIYNIELEFTTGNYVKFGNIILASIAFFLLLYYVLRALGLIDKGDD